MTQQRLSAPTYRGVICTRISIYLGCRPLKTKHVRRFRRVPLSKPEEPVQFRTAGDTVDRVGVYEGLKSSFHSACVRRLRYRVAAADALTRHFPGSLFFFSSSILRTAESTRYSMCVAQNGQSVL